MWQSRYHQSKKRGFTLVELMFAMAFLSVLLIIALMSSLGIMRTYSKGLVLKQVNQSGRAISAEVQRSLRSSQPPLNTEIVASGRMCLGAYSFVWSTGGQEPILYDDGERVGFAKVSDPSGNMCGENRPVVPRDNAVELLAAQEIATIAMQSASLAAAPSYDGQYLYNFTFTIGTDDETLLTDDREACRADADQQYCALNRFRVTATTRGI